MHPYITIMLFITGFVLPGGGALLTVLGDENSFPARIDRGEAVGGLKKAIVTEDSAWAGLEPYSYYIIFSPNVI